MVRVGSLGIRWALMEHAEPWLLTVNCKQMSRPHMTTERHPSLRTCHNIPFARKRCSREVQQKTEGPPAKKAAIVKERQTEEEVVNAPARNLTGKQNEDRQQKEQPDDGCGDELVGLEEKERVQTQPKQKGEEHNRQEKIETEQGQARPKRIRKCQLSDEKDELANTEENLSFISRPWRFIDGKVNRPVCKGILEGVLYHIMSQPGLTQQALLKHYKDALQPVAVLDIVQALLDLGCLTKRTLVKDPKPSLFSCPPPTNMETSVMLAEPDAVFYEPTITCCLRLCRVLPNERHWNDCLT